MSDIENIEEYTKETWLNWSFNPERFLMEGIGYLEWQKDNPGYNITQDQHEYFTLLGQVTAVKQRRFSGGELNAEELIMAKKSGISIRSGQGNGKTFAMAISAIWWLCCHPNSIVPCGGPKAEQIQTTIFKEMGIWIDVMNKYGHPLVKGCLEVMATHIYHKDYAEHRDSWAAYPKIAADSEDEDVQAMKLRGDHAHWMLYIVEESSGMVDGAMKVFESTLASNNIMVQSFNPFKTKGEAYESHHKNKDSWIPLHWSSENSAVANQDKIEKLAKAHGRNSNYFRINVLGEFPKNASDVAIPLEQIRRAFNAEIIRDDHKPLGCGVDPARLGRDSTVYCLRQGHVFGPFFKYYSMRTNENVRNLRIMERDLRIKGFGIDSIGVGGGIYDDCKEEFGMNIWGYEANKASEESRFEKIRDEILWRLKDRFEQGRIVFDFEGYGLEPETVEQIKKELEEELSLLTYTGGVDGKKISFIKKDKMKKLLRRSTDCLDSLKIAEWLDDLWMSSDDDESDDIDDHPGFNIIGTKFGGEQDWRLK